MKVVVLVPQSAQCFGPGRVGVYVTLQSSERHSLAWPGLVASTLRPALCYGKLLALVRRDWGDI